MKHRDGPSLMACVMVCAYSSIWELEAGGPRLYMMSIQLQSKYESILGRMGSFLKKPEKKKKLNIKLIKLMHDKTEITLATKLGLCDDHFFWKIFVDSNVHF